MSVEKNCNYHDTPATVYNKTGFYTQGFIVIWQKKLDYTI